MYNTSSNGDIAGIVVTGVIVAVILILTLFILAANEGRKNSKRRSAMPDSKNPQPVQQPSGYKILGILGFIYNDPIYIVSLVDYPSKLFFYYDEGIKGELTIPSGVTFHSAIRYILPVSFIMVYVQDSDGTLKFFAIDDIT